MTYWVYINKVVENGTYLPSYEIRTEKPIEGKMAALEPGECVDVFKCSISEDRSHVIVNQFCVSNIDDNLIEELTESYCLKRAANT